MLDTALRVKVVTKKTNVEILKTVIAVQDSKTTSRSIFFSQKEGGLIMWESRLYIT